MKRRDFIESTAVSALSLTVYPSKMKTTLKNKKFELKNNINHSVCRWCFEDIPLELFLQTLNNLGIKNLD